MMQHRYRLRTFILLTILALSYLFFFFHLGAYSLKEPDEGRYAEIPREMVEQGEYVVPHLNYVRYFEKPPLLYWVTAASYKAFGVSELSFRFPNALAALLCVLTVFFFASRWFTLKIGFISALILMTSFGYFASARIVTTDMLFTFLLFAALACFYEFYREKRKRFLYLFFTALALAMLTKGPVAVLLLAATILLFLFCEKKLPFLKEMASLRGVLLFGAIAAPWFVLMCIREKEFFQFFFVDQHVLRFLTTKHKRSGPIYYFLPVLFGGLFPWSVFIPRAVVRFGRSHEVRLLLIWSLVVFAFFSVSGSKLPPYILPIFPALAVVLGVFFERCREKPVAHNDEAVVYAAFFLCVTAGGVAFASGSLDPFLAAAGTTLSSHDIRWLALGVAAVSLVIAVLLAFRTVRRSAPLFFVLTGFSASVALGLMLHAPVIDRFNTTKGLAGVLKEAGKDAAVVNYGSFDETLPFYLGRRTYLAQFTGELEMGAKYADARPFFLSDDELLKMLHDRARVFIVVKAKRLNRLQEMGLNEADIVECRDKRCLVGKHPSGVTEY